MIATIRDHRFRIRNCRDEDDRFVYNLFRRNMYSLFVRHWGGWKPKVFRDEFNKKNLKIIEYKTKRVAFYDFEFKDRFSYVNNIQVSTLMQNKGLGTFLMGLIEKETKRQKLKKIRLKVFKENPARKLYLRLGYRVIKDEGPAVTLEKRL